MKTKALLLLFFGFIFNSFAQYAPIKSILEVEGPVNSDIALGTGIIGLGDVNGDGNPDFAVSAWNAKKTYIYYGGKGILDGIADDSIPGGGAIEKGDLNGDGIMDLVIKLNGDTSWVDQLAIYLGRKNTAHRYDTTPNVILREEPVNGYLGNSKFGSTFAIGDLNNDGYDDLVVSALNYNDRGKVYIYLGGVTLSGVPNYTGTGDTVCTNYGANLAIGDLNGDGIADLTISSQQILHCSIDSGYVRQLDVFYGHTNWFFERNKYDQQFNYSNNAFQGIVNFNLVDINADGIKDIAFPDSGKIYFILGNKDSLSSIPDFYMQRDTNDYDMYSYSGLAANIGDINNDGNEDYVLGASSSGEPCLHLHLGSHYIQTQRVAVRCKSFAGSLAYTYVAALGDVNGDGVNDFGTTAPYNALPDNLPQDGYFIIFSGDSNYVTSVKDNPLLKPQDFNLQQNYPNPFNPTTAIEYSVQKEGEVNFKNL